MEHWHGVTDPDGPAVRIEELVPLLRRLWCLHQGPVVHDGRFFHLSVAPTADIPPPLRPDIEIGTAGVNPRMIQAAGAVADRLLCHPTATPAYLAEVVEPALAEGVQRAGRKRSAVALQGVPRPRTAARRRCPAPAARHLPACPRGPAAVARTSAA